MSNNRPVSVAEAAVALGITADAVYKRVERGTIRHDRDEHGRLRVYLEPSDIKFDKSTTTSRAEDDKERLIARLEGEADYLRQQLDKAEERDRHNRSVIATLMQLRLDLEPPEARKGTDEGHEAPD